MRKRIFLALILSIIPTLPAIAASLPGELVWDIPTDNVGTSIAAELTMRLAVGEQRQFRARLTSRGSVIPNTRFDLYQFMVKNSAGYTIGSQAMTPESPPSAGYFSCTISSTTLGSTGFYAAVVATSTSAGLRVVAGWWRLNLTGVLDPNQLAAGSHDNVVVTTLTATNVFTDHLWADDLNLTTFPLYARRDGTNPPTANWDFAGRNLTDIGNLKTTGTLYSPDLISSFTLKADATSVTASLNKKANLAGGNAFTGNQSFGGYNLTAIGAFATTGNATLGDSSADEHTINGDVRVTSGIVLTAGNNIRPSTNSTSAINIAQADGTDFVTFDTTNKRVGIGGVTPITSLHLRRDLAWTAVEQLILENSASGGGAKFLFRGVNSHDQAAIVSYDISSARGALGFFTTTTPWSGNPTEKVRIDPDGNVGVGTTNPGGGAGSSVLSLANSSATPAALANTTHLYSSAGEGYWMDAAGNVTLQTPHNPDTGQWIFFSVNTVTSQVVQIDMERLVTDVEKLTGKSYMVRDREKLGPKMRQIADELLRRPPPSTVAPTTSTASTLTGGP